MSAIISCLVPATVPCPGLNLMQPSPMAETSRLPAPKLRFCIVITPLLQNPAEPDGNGILQFQNSSSPHSKDTECRSRHAFPILPILCLILSYVLILCTV